MYRNTYVLTTPLNDCCVCLDTERTVPELGCRLLAPREPGTVMGTATMRDERIGSKTQVVFFHDGSIWHFDDAGDLVAFQEPPRCLVYRRDGSRHIRRMEGWVGSRLLADIRLEYDAHGRLASAVGSNGGKVTYAYDQSGVLTDVQAPSGKTTYRYRDGLVSEIARDGKMARQFEYGKTGQLVRERGADGTDTAYRVAYAQDSATVTASTGAASAPQVSMRYDAAMRPIADDYADGTRVEWSRGAPDQVKAKITPVGANPLVVSGSRDGRQTELKRAAGGAIQMRCDAGGRMTELAVDGRAILGQEWRPDGQLAEATGRSFSVHPEYEKDGVLRRVLLSPPTRGRQLDRWLCIACDPRGRATELTDFTGAQIRIGYDRSGEAAQVYTGRGALDVERDDQGRPLTLKTSWGRLQRNAYDQKTGELSRQEIAVGGARASVDFAHGLPTVVRNFFGGTTTFSYEAPESASPRLAEASTPNGLHIKYTHDASGRLASVDCSAYRVEYTYDDHGHLTGLRHVASEKGEDVSRVVR